MQIERPSCLEPDAGKLARPVRQWRDGETRQSQGWKVRPVPTITKVPTIGNSLAVYSTATARFYIGYLPAKK